MRDSPDAASGTDGGSQGVGGLATERREADRGRADAGFATYGADVEAGAAGAGDRGAVLPDLNDLSEEFDAVIRERRVGG